MVNRRRGSSIGHLNIGDTQGSSISSAVVNNEIRERRHESHMSADEKANTIQLSPKTEKNELIENAQTKTNKKRRVAKNNLYKTLFWCIPMAFMLCFYTAYYFHAKDQPDHWMHACLKLSYNIPGTDLYGKGKRDWMFLAFHVVFFTWLREFCMQVALKPLVSILGITSKHKANRFLEQAYSLLYYGITGPVGLYIMRYRCPELWYFKTSAFFEKYPHRELDVWLKAFYLLQASFWAQQALVLMLHLEKRRKDFRELVIHHIVTVALIWLSYRFHFTHIGLAVYITMDVSDFFLAQSKILNYLESAVTALFFGIFVFVWIYLRHYLNLIILWSVATEFRTVGPFELDWETQQYKCWISQPITFTLLFLLQLVNLYWLVLVLRIAWRYVRHNIKEDVRSDVEDEDENAN